MTIHIFPQKNKNDSASLPPDHDVLLRECIRGNYQSKTLLDACQYFPRLDAFLLKIARHVLDIPYEADTILNICVSSAIAASIVMKTRPFLKQGTEEHAYVSILTAATKHLEHLQNIEVSFNSNGKRLEWNPLDTSLSEMWNKERVQPDYRKRPTWQKTEMTADNQQFIKMLAASLLSPRDFIIFSDHQPMNLEFV